MSDQEQEPDINEGEEEEEDEEVEEEVDGKCRIIDLFQFCLTCFLWFVVLTNIIHSPLLTVEDVAQPDDEDDEDSDDDGE